jgi:hypothetical protein
MLSTRYLTPIGLTRIGMITAAAINPFAGSSLFVSRTAKNKYTAVANATSRNK